MVIAQQVPAREDIPKEQTWNAESVFESLDAWQSEYQAVLEKLPEIDSYVSQLGNSPTILADWLEYSSMLRRRVMKLYFYALMSIAVNSDGRTN